MKDSKISEAGKEISNNEKSPEELSNAPPAEDETESKRFEKEKQDKLAKKADEDEEERKVEEVKQEVRKLLGEFKREDSFEASIEAERLGNVAAFVTKHMTESHKGPLVQLLVETIHRLRKREVKA